MMPMMCKRGQAGTAIIWKRSIDCIIEPLKDGCQQLLAIKIDADANRIILMNAYITNRRSSTCCV